MSRWRRLAVELFPEKNVGFWAFQRSHVSLYQIFFELENDIDKKIQDDDREWIGNVITLCEWCFKQRKRNPWVWNAAATALLEHLADNEIRAELIPTWLKPDMFEAMQFEFIKRRERQGEGKARGLFDVYNKVNDTRFKIVPMLLLGT